MKRTCPICNKRKWFPGKLHENCYWDNYFMKFNRITQLQIEGNSVMESIQVAAKEERNRLRGDA